MSTTRDPRPRRALSCRKAGTARGLRSRRRWPSPVSSRRRSATTISSTSSVQRVMEARKIDGTRTPRDERRRAQHNEVERRRRDKINNWIVQLSKIIPDCHADNSKTGASKGGILSKACDYIRELRQTNQRMQETFKEAERLQMDNELLRQQIEELKNENALLRAQLQQHNLEMVGESTRQ